MGDGVSSGLTLSEMGISAVKKTQKVIKPFVQGVKQQLTGSQQGQPGAQMPGGGVEPNETGPAQSGSFDIGSMFSEPLTLKNQVGQQSMQNQQQMMMDTTAQKQEDQQKIEALRKQLHQMYYEDFLRKAEGRDQKQQETVQEKQEREDQEARQKEMKLQEEEKKKQPITPAGVKGRQGAHEGLKQKG